ncbi:hypothetical protein [Synechocystis sp. LKSZ1]|uniref:hypothetical protein n=1 Tax=Synechocystis sp. LKSZ1 TaxID=3144951 RepID=UPI00336BD6AC
MAFHTIKFLVMGATLLVWLRLGLSAAGFLTPTVEPLSDGPNAGKVNSVLIL